MDTFVEQIVAKKKGGKEYGIIIERTFDWSEAVNKIDEYWKNTGNLVCPLIE